jgi:hypothetical protein
MFDLRVKKNPWLSLWLSGAHSVANSARGTVTAAARRQPNAAVAQAMNDVVGLWVQALTQASTPRRRGRVRSRSAR